MEYGAESPLSPTVTATIHHSFNLVCYCGVDRTNTAWRPSLVHTHTHAHIHTQIQAGSGSGMFTHALMTLTEKRPSPAAHLCYKHEHTPPPTVQGSYLLCARLWPLAQGPSPTMYHQSFKAIKHFSMRIARSSLSKTERSDSQSHFLPNPIKGGEGRREKNEVEDLKWRAFI